MVQNRQDQDVISTDANIDLSKVPAGMIFQQVNVAGVMGAGLAKALRRVYPQVYDQYEDLYNHTDPRNDDEFHQTRSGNHEIKKNLSGYLQEVKINNHLSVFNSFSQDNFGHNGHFTNEDQLLNNLQKATQIAQQRHLRLFVPLGVGSGLAGGDKNRIVNGLRALQKKYPGVIVVSNPDSPNRQMPNGIIEDQQTDAEVGNGDVDGVTSSGYSFEDHPIAGLSQTGGSVHVRNDHPIQGQKFVMSLTGVRPGSIKKGRTNLYESLQVNVKNNPSPWQPVYDHLVGIIRQQLKDHPNDTLELHSGMAEGADLVWAQAIVNEKQRLARKGQGDRIRFVADIPTASQSDVWWQDGYNGTKEERQALKGPKKDEVQAQILSRQPKLRHVHRERLYQYDQLVSQWQQAYQAGDQKKADQLKRQIWNLRIPQPPLIYHELLKQSDAYVLYGRNYGGKAIMNVRNQGMIQNIDQAIVVGTKSVFDPSVMIPGSGTSNTLKMIQDKQEVLSKNGDNRILLPDSNKLFLDTPEFGFTDNHKGVVRNQSQSVYDQNESGQIFRDSSGGDINMAVDSDEQKKIVAHDLFNNTLLAGLSTAVGTGKNGQRLDLGQATFEADGSIVQPYIDVLRAEEKALDDSSLSITDRVKVAMSDIVKDPDKVNKLKQLLNNYVSIDASGNVDEQLIDNVASLSDQRLHRALGHAYTYILNQNTLAARSGRRLVGVLDVFDDGTPDSGASFDGAGNNGFTYLNYQGQNLKLGFVPSTFFVEAQQQRQDIRQANSRSNDMQLNSQQTNVRPKKQYQQFSAQKQYTDSGSKIFTDPMNYDLTDPNMRMYQKGTVVTYPGEFYRVYESQGLDGSPSSDLFERKFGDDAPTWRRDGVTEDSPVTSDELSRALKPYVDTKNHLKSLRSSFQAMSTRVPVHYLNAKGQDVSKQIKQTQNVSILTGPNGKHLTWSNVNQMLLLVRAISSTGIDYDIIPNKDDGTIDLKLTGNAGLRVKILDIDHPYLVGSIRDREGGSYTPSFNGVSLKNGTLDLNYQSKYDPKAGHNVTRINGTQLDDLGIFHELDPANQTSDHQLVAKSFMSKKTSKNPNPAQRYSSRLLPSDNDRAFTYGNDKDLDDKTRQALVRMSDESSYRTYMELPESVKNYLAVLPLIKVAGLLPENTDVEKQYKEALKNGLPVTNASASAEGGNTHGRPISSVDAGTLTGLTLQRSVDRSETEVEHLAGTAKNMFNQGSLTAEERNGLTHPIVEMSHAIVYSPSIYDYSDYKDPYVKTKEEANGLILDTYQNARQSYVSMLFQDNLSANDEALAEEQIKFRESTKAILKRYRLTFDDTEASLASEVAINAVMDAVSKGSIDKKNWRIDENLSGALNNLLADDSKDPLAIGYKKRLANMETGTNEKQIEAFKQLTSDIGRQFYDQLNDYTGVGLLNKDIQNEYLTTKRHRLNKQADEKGWSDKELNDKLEEVRPTIDLGDVIHTSSKLTSNVQHEFDVINAMKQSDFVPMEHSHLDFEEDKIQERLLTFDEDSAMNISQLNEMAKKETASINEKNHPEYYYDHELINSTSPYQFKANILNEVSRELASQGITPDRDENGLDDIKIDKNGLVHWSGVRHRYSGYANNERTDKSQRVSGTIGQFPTPDRQGILRVNGRIYATSNHSVYLAPPVDPENPSKIDVDAINKEMASGIGPNARLRAYNYEYYARMEARRAITGQVSNVKSGNLTRPKDTTIANKLVHGEVATIRVSDEDELKPSYRVDPETGKIDKDHPLRTVEDVSAKLVDWHNRSRFNNMFKAATGTSEVVNMMDEIKDAAVKWQKKHPGHSINELTFGEVANMVQSPIMFLGATNGGEFATPYNKGIFSIMAAGQGKSQALVHIYDRHAKIDPRTGKVEPNHDAQVGPDYAGDDRAWTGAATEAQALFKYIANVPFDRGFVAMEQYLKAKAIDRDTHVAMINLKGMNMEDGSVISKNYAKSHLVKDPDGNLRPLQVGDKISDPSGNKTTISEIIDPNMSLEEAEDRNLTDAVLLFRDNPKLEMAVSGISLVSRKNAALAKFIHDTTDGQTMKYRVPKRDKDGNLIPETDKNGNPIEDTSRLVRTRMADSRKTDQELLDEYNAEIKAHGKPKFEPFARNADGSYKHPLKYQMEEKLIDTGATMGIAPFFVTDQLVDKKTTENDRKFSPLLFNVDMERKAWGIINEVNSYNTNKGGSSFASQREFLRVCGIDFGPFSEFEPLVTNLPGSHLPQKNPMTIHPGESRKEFTINLMDVKDGHFVLSPAGKQILKAFNDIDTNNSASVDALIKKGMTDKQKNAFQKAQAEQAKYKANGDYKSFLQFSNNLKSVKVSKRAGIYKTRNGFAARHAREYKLDNGFDKILDEVIRRTNQIVPSGNIKHPEKQLDEGTAFLKQIANAGGDFKVPEALSFTLPGFPDPRSDVKKATGLQNIKTNILSVLPPSMRKNTKQQDGVTKVSDYSRFYAEIAQNVARYNVAMAGFMSSLPAKPGDKAYTQKRNKLLQMAKARFAKDYSIQKPVNRLVNAVAENELGLDPSDKTTFLRTKVMAVNVPNSVTAVQTNGFSTVDIDEVEVSPEIAKRMKYDWDPKTGEAWVRGHEYDKENWNMAHVHRDPAWHGPAALGLKVRVNPSITGIRTSPLMVSMYDGDYDGDTIGVMPMYSKAAQKDLHTKLSVGSNVYEPFSSRNAEAGTLLNISAEFVDSMAKADHATKLNHGKGFDGCNDPQQWEKLTRHIQDKMHKRYAEKLEYAKQNGDSGAVEKYQKLLADPNKPEIKIGNVKQYLQYRISDMVDDHYHKSFAMERDGRPEDAEKERSKALDEVKKYVHEGMSAKNNHYYNAGIDFRFDDEKLKIKDAYLPDPNGTGEKIRDYNRIGMMELENTQMDKDLMQYVQEGAKGHSEEDIKQFNEYFNRKDPRRELKKFNEKINSKEFSKQPPEEQAKYIYDFTVSYNVMENTWEHDQRQVQAAVQAKSDLTPEPGQLQKDLVASERGLGTEALQAVNSWGYKGTMGPLQVKHNPAVARRLAEVFVNGLSLEMNGHRLNNPMVYGNMGESEDGHEDKLGDDSFLAAKLAAFTQMAASGMIEAPQVGVKAKDLVLDPAVNDGNFTQEQVDKMNKVLSQNVDPKVKDSNVVPSLTLERANSLVHGILDKDGVNSLDFKQGLTGGKDSRLTDKVTTKQFTEDMAKYSEVGNLGFVPDATAKVAQNMSEDGRIVGTTELTKHAKNSIRSSTLDQVDKGGFDLIKKLAHENADQNRLVSDQEDSGLYTDRTFGGSPNPNLPLTRQRNVVNVLDYLNSAKKAIKSTQESINRLKNGQRDLHYQDNQMDEAQRDLQTYKRNLVNAKKWSQNQINSIANDIKHGDLGYVSDNEAMHRAANVFSKRVLVPQDATVANSFNNQNMLQYLLHNQKAYKKTYKFIDHQARSLNDAFIPAILNTTKCTVKDLQNKGSRVDGIDKDEDEIMYRVHKLPDDGSGDPMYVESGHNIMSAKADVNAIYWVNSVLKKSDPVGQEKFLQNAKETMLNLNETRNGNYPITKDSSTKDVENYLVSQTAKVLKEEKQLTAGSSGELLSSMQDMVNTFGQVSTMATGKNSPKFYESSLNPEVWQKQTNSIAYAVMSLKKLNTDGKRDLSMYQYAMDEAAAQEQKRAKDENRDPRFTDGRGANKYFKHLLHRYNEARDMHTADPFVFNDIGKASNTPINPGDDGKGGYEKTISNIRESLSTTADISNALNINHTRTKTDEGVTQISKGVLAYVDKSIQNVKAEQKALKQKQRDAQRKIEHEKQIQEYKKRQRMQEEKEAANKEVQKSKNVNKKKPDGEEGSLAR